MRAMLAICAMLQAAGATGPGAPPVHGLAARTAGERAGGERLFISPMGEPFRSVRGGAEPQDLWFAGADTNHDGALTRAEFEADAARFFAVLDRNHDGEIDPDDIDYYESTIAPEIRVGAASFAESQSGGDGGEGSAKPVYPDRQGAARYGYFSFPEPVTAADRNYNRGVSADEFRRAADARFDVLDTNRDGRIDHDELPRIDPPRAGAAGRGRGGGGFDGGGRGRRGGGMGGGGMGGGFEPEQ